MRRTKPTEGGRRPRKKKAPPGMPNLRMRPLPGQGQSKPRMMHHQKPTKEVARAGPKEVAYQRKVAAARAVGYRETLLMQLNAVVLHWPRRASAQRSVAEAARLLRNVAGELRTAGLRCVEKIVAWVLVESKDCTRPRPFLWNGKDYLLKMNEDLDFVSEALGAEAWRLACFCRGNPLLLTRDEIQGVGKARDVGRLQAASVVILDVVRRSRADQVVARSSRKRRQGKRIEGKEERNDATYRRTGEAFSPKKAPRASPSPAKGVKRRLAEVRKAALAYDEEMSLAASVAEPPEPAPAKAPRPKPPTPQRAPTPKAATPKAATPEPAPKAPTPLSTRMRRQNTDDAVCPPPETAAPPAFAVGDCIEGDFEGLGEFYTGVIGAVHEDGSYYVRYDDGDEEDCVPTTRLRNAPAASPASGQTVAIHEPDVWRNDEASGVSDEPTQPPLPEETSEITPDDYDDDFDDVEPLEGAAKYIFEPGLLGEGAYGEVKQARHKETGQQVAVKRLKVVVEGEDDDDAARYAVQTAERERDVLLLLGTSHKNVATMMDWWREDVKIKPHQTVSAPVLCFELAGSTCLEALEELGPLPKGLCVGLTSDLCAGLAHAHSLGIVHRDVKPENVLLSRDCTKNDLMKAWDDPTRPQLRLCDFGAARKLEDVSGKSCLDLTHYIGSRWYRAPEMMASSTKYGVAVDVWGAACITAELATGEPLFPGDDEHAVLRRVSRVLGPFPDAMATYLRGLGVPLQCLDAGPAPGLKACRRGALVTALSESVVEVLRDMLHCDVGKRPGAAQCVARLQAAMRPRTAPAPEAALKCWLNAPLLQETWEPVVHAGVDAFKTAPASPHRAVPDAQHLYAAAADALVVQVQEDAASVEAWLGELLLGDTPCGAARSVLRCLRWSVDAAVVPRVARCRDWVLAQQQRGELTLTQAVDAVEAQVGKVDATGSKRASAAAHALQKAYVILNEAAIRGAPAVLRDLGEPDSSEKSDLGAGSDVGCAAVGGVSLLPGEGALGSAEERFHVRSVNEALAVVTPMLVDSEVASAAKARGLLRLEGLLGLPRLRDHAALLRPASKAALLYVALARRPAQRLNLVTSRKRAWEDCEALLSKHAQCLDEAASQCLAETPFTLEEEPDDASDDDAPLTGAASFVVCPYYKVPFGQKYVEGSAVEEGEGLGPRKELFALLGAAATRTWTPVSGNALKIETCEGARSLRVACDEADPQHVKAGDCLAVDFEGDTLELVVEKVADHTLRVSTNAPAVRVLAKRFGDDEDAETKLLEALAGCVAEVRRGAAPLLAHRKDLETLWPNASLPRNPANAKRLATLGLLIGSAVPNQCQLPLDLPPLFFEVLGVAEDAPTELSPDLVGAFLQKRGDAALRTLDASYDDALRGLRALDAPGLKSVADMEGLTLTSNDAALEIARKTSGDRCRELEWQLRALRRGFERAMPKKVRRAVKPSARDLQRVACGAPEVRGDFKFRDVFRVVMDAELRDCRPLHDALWAVVDGEDDAAEDLELKKIDDLTGELDPRRCEPLTPMQRRKLLVFVTGVQRLPARHAEFLTVELPFLPFGVDEQRRMLVMVPQSHTCDNILELPNYWEALLKTKTDEARPPRRGSRECNALERELRKIVRAKLLVALDNAVGYGLDALEPHVTHALACAAAEDDAAAAALIASSRIRSSNDAINNDDNYNFFDDEDNESIPSIPGLKEEDHIPLLKEAGAATTRPSLQSDDEDIPDLVDAPRQEDNSVDLEILHALAASPIRDARPASPDAELSVGDLGGTHDEDDLSGEELGVTFRPVEAEILSSPKRPTEEVLDEISEDERPASPASEKGAALAEELPADDAPNDGPGTTAALDDLSDVELEPSKAPSTPDGLDELSGIDLGPSKAPKTPAADDLSDVEELEPPKPKTPADDLSDVEELEPAPTPPAPAFAIGARVEARFEGGDQWYPGKIFSAHDDGTYYIRFDDGDEEDRVPAASIRKVDAPAAEAPAADEPPVASEPTAADDEGDDILAGLEDLGLNTTAQTPPPAEPAEPSKAILDKLEEPIKRPESPSDDDILSDIEDLPGLDLEEPTEAPRDVEEPEPAPRKPSATEDAPAFAIGARVEARFNGGEAWYPGKVFSAHPDGTYFVRFDDGDEEDNVPAEYVRPEVVSASGSPVVSDNKPAKPADDVLAEFDFEVSDGEPSPRQVTPPTAKPARQATPPLEPVAAPPSDDDDILAGLDDLGLNTMSVSEPPARADPPAAQKTSGTEDFDYDALEADLFDAPASKPGTAGTGIQNAYDDSRPSTYDSRPYDSKPGTAGTDGYYDSRPETREQASKPGTADFYDPRPQTGASGDFSDDFSDFEEL